ncbi:hypothetical protein H072_6145 [Dactylellina haptotyla CBS 200.50]|uniref:Ubiquitin-like modifier HUB1 n=1 Tax=Dactylellina haptotyla (strain CBS 200.50) TaxID=1284197 RepID=S8BKW8_DACHA|nr:hypothetical protein H072_6145 [Dactylellina haptotyla CBS 200.50]
MIEVTVNDRLGKKVKVKCEPDDLIGDFKKLLAAQIGTSPEKIVLKKWYTTFKDHITLSDYEIGNGSSLELYLGTPPSAVLVRRSSWTCAPGYLDAFLAADDAPPSKSGWFSTPHTRTHAFKTRPELRSVSQIIRHFASILRRPLFPLIAELYQDDKLLAHYTLRSLGFLTLAAKMDLSQPFRLVNLAVGALMVWGGIAQLFDFTTQHLILAIYIIVFGAATAILEFQIPPQVSRYANFMFSFIGRGVFYILIGAVLDHKSWYSWVPGLIVVFAGIVYVALEFVPSIEPPENMREGGYDGLGETV